MQDPSSPVSAGNISPAIVGPSKDTKEVYLVGGLVVAVAIITGSFWYYSGQDQPYASKNQSEPLTNAQVTQVLKTSTIPPAEAIAHSQTVPAVRSKSDSTHAEGHGSLMDNLFPSFADPSTTEPSPLPTDSASGS
ncbi:MAG: hypothetical protein HZB34_07950 [Nitrospirae bacterium]|jgi:hypothetical protein|nr:hypothetical protein [Nitrospirota bacterium]